MAYTEILAASSNFKIIGGRADEIRYQYQDVLDDFYKAKTIRIATYGFNAQYEPTTNNLFNQFVHSRYTDAKIIVGVPNIQKNIYDRDKWAIQLEKSVANIKSCFTQGKVRINAMNHAKLIGTENILYIGSENITSGSWRNFETGIIIEDKNIINNVYESIFDKIWDESIPVSDQYYSFVPYMSEVSAQLNFYMNNPKRKKGRYTYKENY